MTIELAVRLFALVRTALFALLFMGAVGVYLPLYFGLLHRTATLDLHLLGLAPLLLGGYLSLRCAFEFAWRGLGTPAPFDPPVHLVLCGSYRYVRNPMYSAMAVFMIGEWLVWGTDLKGALVYLAAYAVCVFLFVVGYEEPGLQKKFGEEYSIYRQNVPRFVPRLTPWDAAKAKSAAGSGGAAALL
ncbi:MAG TPA: methyltransferase [Terriglobales bacterium]|nr:methyltransferase [Terriglobales bacterium]